MSTEAEGPETAFAQTPLPTGIRVAKETEVLASGVRSPEGWLPTVTLAIRSTDSTGAERRDLYLFMADETGELGEMIAEASTQAIASMASFAEANPGEVIADVAGGSPDGDDGP